jgi:hypothetical protein
MISRYKAASLPFRPAASAVLVAIACLTYSQQSHSQTYTYAPWLRQIGITNAIESAANWGKGQLLGVVDTGINATHPQFATGQVSQVLSSCAAVSFRCSNGFADDHGHGTAVASIAAGNRPSLFSTITAGGYTTVAGNFIGVAPSANILSEKVLNSAGSGYSTDVANGVKKAADAGATVINVSITYGNDPATVAAINYAASKGAFIVWAGGNSAQNLLSNLNTTGLTQVAIQHLVFAGSVNSSNVASGFTNKPGTGSLVNTSGAKTTYAARWVMAPGESILAPYTLSGNSAYALWSGTSMSTPVVSGSLMLLQNAWPILRTRGTTADLLLATATDLGTKGVDTVYGNGLVNLTTAFNPFGPLTVVTTSGQAIAVSSLTGSMITSGALGSLSTVQTKLAAYTAFDSYTRNFTVNLSGLIRTPSSPATLNPLPTNTYSGPKVMKYNGGELAYSLEYSGDRLQHLGEVGYSEDQAQTRPMAVGYTTFTDAAGTVSALGYGGPVAYPFAKALFNDDLVARQMTDFSASSTASLAQGGYQFSYGTAITKQLRMAASYSATPSATALTPEAPQNTQYRIGASYSFTPAVTAGVTYSNVAEQSGLLGSAYSQGGILSLGSNQTDVLGLSLALRVDRDSGFLLNTEFGRTRAGQGGSGSLFGETSVSQSRSWAATYLKQNVWTRNDQFVASIKQPLRMTSGSASMMNASTAENGEPIYDKTWVSLVPNGREIDYTVHYRMPVGKTDSLMLQAAHQKDALNIAGNNQSQLGIIWDKHF